MRLTERFRGCRMGLAVGDSLGTSPEFKQPGSFDPITDMVGGGPFHLKPGEWTGDTSMALCLPESLIECREFDPVDQLTRYCRWWREGHLSSTGTCFDIGNTVRDALDRFERTREPYCGSADPMTAGNGSIMRLAPVPSVFVRDPKEAIERAGDSSRITHGAREAIDACRYFAGLIVGALQGRPKNELLSPGFCPMPGLWNDTPLAPKIVAVAAGSFKRRDPPTIGGTGYVVDCLEAALWAFNRSDSFEEGALLAVNLGDDADTIGAVYGQLVGAFYGSGGIPRAWHARIVQHGLIESLADRIFALSQGRGRPPEPRPCSSNPEEV